MEIKSLSFFTSNLSISVLVTMKGWAMGHGDENFCWGGGGGGGVLRGLMTDMRGVLAIMPWSLMREWTSFDFQDDRPKIKVIISKYGNKIVNVIAILIKFGPSCPCWDNEIYYFLRP